MGSFTFQLEVTSNDTERSILDKLNTAFNDNTLFDLNFNMGNKNTSYVYKSDHNASSMLKNDFLPQDSVEDINLNIHSGSETTDKIYFDYDCLRLKTLGLEDTNVLTEENALAAIDEISSALEMISAQRSYLEHTKTAWSMLIILIKIQQKTHRPQSHRSVIRIWQKRWFSTLISIS